MKILFKFCISFELRRTYNPRGEIPPPHHFRWVGGPKRYAAMYEDGDKYRQILPI